MNDAFQIVCEKNAVRRFYDVIDENKEDVCKFLRNFKCLRKRRKNMGLLHSEMHQPLVVYFEVMKKFLCYKTDDLWEPY